MQRTWFSARDQPYKGSYSSKMNGELFSVLSIFVSIVSAA